MWSAATMSRLSQFRSSKAGIAERYDALAKGYEQGFQSGYRADIQNETVFSTMNEFLHGKFCRILDAGGGTGFYSIPLAVEGHEVVVLDLSQKMLDVARLKARKLGVADKVKVLLGDMEDIEQPNESFDVVLCHLALCYVPSPSKALAEFSRILRKSGILSLMVENKMFFSISEAFKGDFLEASDRFRRKRLFAPTSRLGIVRTFERQELLALFSQAKFEPVRNLGLRVVSDYLYIVQKASPDNTEALKKLESLLSRSPEWNGIGRFHYFICKKASK